MSERSLTEWQKEGLPVASYADNRGQANQYDTTKVIAWYIARELASVMKEKPRDRLDRLKADEVELNIKERIGELAPAALFERIWDDHVIAARTEFLSLPDTLATELTALTHVKIDTDIIAEYINRALDKLSKFGEEYDEYTDDEYRNTSTDA